MRDAFPLLTTDHLPEGSLIVHASETWADAMARRDYDFFEKLGPRAQADGVQTGYVRHGSDLSNRLLSQDHRHVFLGPRGPARQRALFAMPGYIWGFWYLDPQGIHWNSSLADQMFDPATIDAEAASYFFNGVSGWMLRENLSKFDQARRQSSPPPRAHAVIFLQDIETYRRRVHHLTSDQMIRIAASVTSDRIYVKLHPATTGERRDRMIRFCQRFPQVELAEHSVHDLIAASDIVVTQNSATGFEALMQKKPVITCAQTDYHHATVPVFTAQDLRDALVTAPDRMSTFPYDAYFYWFLGLNLLEPQKPDFADRAWARIQRHFA